MRRPPVTDKENRLNGFNIQSNRLKTKFENVRLASWIHLNRALYLYSGYVKVLFIVGNFASAYFRQLQAHIKLVNVLY